MEQELDPMGEQKKVVYVLDTDDIEKIKIIAARKRTTQNDLFKEATRDLIKKYEKLWK